MADTDKVGELASVFRSRKELQILIERREQNQGAESGRTDRIALGHRLGGVANGVQGVGGNPNLGGKASHFGYAAGVVRDRAERVEGDDKAGQGQHGGGGDSDTEQAAEDGGDDNAGNDHQGRTGGRLKGDGQALDHVGAVTGLGGLGDRLHRAEARAGVVFSDHHDGGRDGQADKAAAE